jgi:uncharacterized membrane protein YfcA
MNYLLILIILMCATAYYRIGEYEYRKGVLLGAVSVLVSAVTFFVLGWGILACIGAQVGIFVVLTIINMFRETGVK